MVIFAPIGGLLLYAGMKPQEIAINYSHCATEATGNYTEIPSKYYSTHFTSSMSNSPTWKATFEDDSNGNNVTTCHLQFDIPNNISAPVFLYYRLSSFYQNHRKYETSYDYDQLRGSAVKGSVLTSDCKPFRTNSAGKIYYPCGKIANSMFNDTFSSPILLNAAGNSANNETYYMTNKGIAWPSDKKRIQKSKYSVDDIVPPPNWVAKYPDGYTDADLTEIGESEELMNWMRTSGVPTFEKLALRNDTEKMANGQYQVDVVMNYPVSIFGGKKYMVIRTETLIGGRNLTLGICYLVVGILCAFLGIVFLIKHLVSPRKIGDHSYLTFGSDNSTREIL